MFEFYKDNPFDNALHVRTDEIDWVSLSSILITLKKTQIKSKD